MIAQKINNSIKCNSHSCKMKKERKGTEENGATR